MARLATCGVLMAGALFSAVVTAAEKTATVSEKAVDAPLIPIRESANGAPIFTHEADVRLYMIRIPAKWPTAVGALAFLEKREELKTGKVFLSADDAAAALKALAEATGRDLDLMGGPRVAGPAGNPAVAVIGPEWRYMINWEKAPGTPDSWIAKDVASRQMGQSAKVFPRLATDGSVQLSVTFGSVEFDGFIEHPEPNERTTVWADFVALNRPDAKAATRGINKGATTTAPVYEPIFFSCEVTTDVRIPPGKTLVLLDEGKEVDRKKSDSLLVFVSVETKPLPKRL